MTEINVTISHLMENNEDESSSSSSQSPDTSPSVSITSAVMPYVVKEPMLEILIPDFKLTAWNPTKGTDFLSLMRMPEPLNFDHISKIKVTPIRRRQRREGFYNHARSRYDVKKLFRAVSDNDVVAVNALIKFGVNTCVTDSKQRSALHIAASKGHDAIVSILVRNGANPNQKDCIGNTPLHLAVCANHVATVTILLEAGTDICALDHAGRTPMHLAQSRINVLQRELDQGFATQEVKDEVLQVANMMNRYLRMRDDDVSVSQLTDLCHQLQLSNTKEELSSVNQLLDEFTCLTLNKPATSIR